jgi:hypothetical protein
MGVVFKVCEHCEKVFPDCQDYFYCTCDSIFCSAECGGRQVEQEQTAEYEEHISCIICRGELIPDSELLSFLLAKYNLTWEEAVELYKKDD